MDPLSGSLDQHRDANNDEYEGPPVTQQGTELRDHAKIRQQEEDAYDDQNDGDGW
jgi:hypothetical protein